MIRNHLPPPGEEREARRGQVHGARFEKPPFRLIVRVMTARKIILGQATDPALDAEDAARLVRYHALIQEGLDELDRGEGIEVTDVKAWLETLGRQPV